MDIIFCRGGCKDAPHIAAQAGMSYGIQYTYKAYAPVYFLDAGLDPVIWPTYYRIAQRLRPRLAVVPDYYYPHQLPRLLAQIDSLRSLGITPLVCPKFAGAVADIPADCRVALSVPTETYAGFLPDDHECAGRDVHLLGGSPAQQLYIMRYRYPGAVVQSVDGNKLADKAITYKQIWDETGARWQQMPTYTYTNAELMLFSAKATVRYLRNPKSGIHLHHPSVRQCRARTARQPELIPVQ